MHDTPTSHWHEPKTGQNAGYGAFKRPMLPYDRFMEAEGIPVFRGIGVKRVQDLPLAPWRRLGGRGSYVQLFGTEGLWGMYAVEVPGAGALNIERHLYEKIVLVIEGRGSTEVWQEEQQKRHVFEWQKGSLFTIPLNAFHRIVNAGSVGNPTVRPVAWWAMLDGGQVDLRTTGYDTRATAQAWLETGFPRTDFVDELLEPESFEQLLARVS